MEGKVRKLYCYVDESGQDTEGQLFLVALVVTGEDRDKLVAETERIEQETGKGFLKWRKTSLTKKIAYVNAILSGSIFSKSLFYAHYKNSSAYSEMSVRSVADVIKYKSRGDYKATVIVDGLRDVEIPRFAKKLRSQNIKLHKLRGMRDESSSLLRLADALAGFIRDCLESQPYTEELQKLLWKIVKKIN